MDEEIKSEVVTINNITMTPAGQSVITKVETTAGKYEFWDTKQDGSPTKAKAQYDQYRYSKGDTVKISFKEKFSDKLDRSGRPFVNRVILSWEKADGNSFPTHGTQRVFGQFPNNVPQTVASPAPASHQETYSVPNKEIQDMQAQINGLRRDVNMLMGVESDVDEIRIEDVPF